MSGFETVSPLGEIGLLLIPPLVMLALMALGLSVFALATRRRRGSAGRRSAEPGQRRG